MKEVHKFSIEAYHEGKMHGFFNDRQTEIIHAVRGMKECTVRELCERLGYSDLNAIRPRCTELIDKGVLEEAGSKKCDKTGRTVMTVRITPLPKPQLELF